MFGLTKAEKAAKATRAKEQVTARMEARKKWIGKELVAAQTVEVTRRTVGTVTMMPFVTQATIVSGVVTAVGNNCVKLGDTWYLEDWTEPAGIRVIEVIAPSVTAAHD